MRSSDYSNPAPDVSWKEPGVGMFSEFICSRCNVKKSTLGSKVWKKSPRLMQCLSCFQKSTKEKS